ncbi:MAG: hypothetical protein KAI17_07395 [Thiotrichaceae bacterium]|nr:hypothetical protein [Thiotrichaceae bacterium]
MFVLQNELFNNYFVRLDHLSTLNNTMLHSHYLAMVTIIYNGSVDFSTIVESKLHGYCGLQGNHYQHHYASGASPDNHIYDNGAGSTGSWTLTISVPGF